MAKTTANKLSEEQRETLLKWLAADYSWRLIRVWFQERRWPEVSRQAISGYRKRNGIEIEKLRKERRESALSQGLAIKEERIRRMCEHADALDAIKWEPDEKGRLWNEKAWRETVSQIADEMEPKKIEHTGANGTPLTIVLREVIENAND